MTQGAGFRFKGQASTGQSKDWFTGMPGDRAVCLPAAGSAQPLHEDPDRADATTATCGGPDLEGRGLSWRQQSMLASLPLTLAILMAHGYHPLADDGAIYVSGIKKLLQPGLYRTDGVFVTSHMRFSVFSHLFAGAVQYSHATLPVVLFISHLASIFLFLLGCSAVAEKLFLSAASRWGAVLLAAACFTLPVAGTALFLMDPYVTARSFSTPLSLFALAATLAESWWMAALWIVLAGLLHPLMAAFTGLFLIAVILASRRMWRSLAASCAAAFLLSAGIFLSRRGAMAAPAYREAVLSRTYFFLSRWEWYEYLGIVLPLILLLIAAWRLRGRGPVGSLCIAATAYGGCALLVALCFVHSGGSFLLARLQPLRAFHILYAVGVLLLGGFAGWLTRRRVWAAGLLYTVSLCAMAAGQRLTYRSSQPVEWPGSSPRNPWQQAFLWIRANTPPDAIFAVDSAYIEAPGEDAQSFRANSERSVLADWYKDGGVAAMFPEAQEPWLRQMRATAGLNQATDAEREARTRPFGVSWILLPAQARTDLTCPYVNQAVRVCRFDIR